MPTPHKYKDVLIAYANGYKLQHKSSSHDWADLIKVTQMFPEESEWRVKPMKIDKWVWSYVIFDEKSISSYGKWQLTDLYTEKEFNNFIMHKIQNNFAHMSQKIEASHEVFYEKAY